MRKMTSYEIRDTFLEYFRDHGHTILPSASLLVLNDPTLLWNNAGVTPLKKYFDGSMIPINRRLTNSQKCIRTNDIENVGDNTHHTFFEMLGNFSIGDYFKSEAIEMAYELMLSDKYFAFPKDKIYITVYKEDKEAYDKWVSMGVDPSHLIKLESNFWEIGEGPCGPDSEIFYDRGTKYDKDNLGIKLLTDEIDNSRYVEVWNNVFSQFNAKEGLKRNEYPELPSKNIDTGMGLERMTCVINEAESAYDTDLFSKIIASIEELSNKKYTNEREFRIIADHIRCITFAIGDGALFSNEGRGYVLRRLLRRAVRFGRKLGISGNFMYKIVDAVVDTMKSYYPEISDNKEHIKNIILKEEELFDKTLESGEKKLNEMLDKYEKVLPGNEAFKLYDTYGFPFELTLEYLEEKGYTVSKEEFNKCMENQKEMARNARKDEASMNIQNAALLNFKEDSKFVGYDECSIETEVIALIKGDKLVDELTDQGYVILKETPFYAEKGGQISDNGYIYNSDMKCEVEEMIISPNKQHVHIVNVLEGKIKLHDKVTAKINTKLRDNIAKNHSATHLLQTALQQALNYDVAQAGSRVTDKYLRFDFTYPNKLTEEDVILTETLVNEMIATNTDSYTKVMSLEEAKLSGAIHQFDEKYEDEVRVVTIKDSVQLCGGTHVKNTGDIKRFAIKYVETKGSNVYRMDATTDENIETELYEIIKPYNIEMIKLLNKAKNIMDDAKDNNIEVEFNVDIDNSKPTCYKDILFNRNEVAMVREKVKELEKEYTIKYNEKQISSSKDFEDIKVLNNIDYIVKRVNNYDLTILKQLMDNTFSKIKNGLIFIVNVKDNNVNYLCRSNCILDAGALVKEASIKSNGNGGGSKNFAQGGGTTAEFVEDILSEIEKKIGEL